MAGNMRIGVVIAAYDMAPWVGRCLSSLLDQTHPDWIAVVVDDGSRDGTAAVVGCFPDRRIRLVRQPNAGVSAARNRGLAALPESDAILFLDADDWLAPDGLAVLAGTLARWPAAAAACGGFALMRAEATPGDAPERVVRPLTRGADALPALLVGNRFANGGHVLLRRAAVARTGLFNTRLRFGEDWEYWVRVALGGAFMPVPQQAPVLFVRRRAEGAYASRATDPAAFAPAMSAIFANPDVTARFSRRRLAALQRAARAESAWIAGRALLRAGRTGDGLGLLRQAVARHPRPRRAAILLALHVGAWVRTAWGMATWTGGGAPARPSAAPPWLGRTGI
jgi:glycosyltransferase involved in cell wall biosynthesis